MSKKHKFLFFLSSILFVVFFIALFSYGRGVGVLAPKGIVAAKQLDMFIICSLLMLIVVVPVFVMTAYFFWKYREGNKEAKYSPDWDHSVAAELVWWGVPFIIVIFLSILTYKGTKELDPYKPLEGKAKTIQVVALQWKWLFIYPEEGIATVNYIQFPEKTPIRFEITADAPMNSFWIPELGGQIYAMPGMDSVLYLNADRKGRFNGVSANLSGSGFAGMRFVAEATSKEDFEGWVKGVKREGSKLGLSEYEALVAPTANNPVTVYRLKDKKLFHQIGMKYMTPTAEMKNGK